MPITFSLRSALKRSWKIVASYPWFFAILSLVMLVLNISARRDDPVILMALVVVATIFWSYVWLSVALAAIDGKSDHIGFNALKHHMPSIKEFFKLIAVSIVAALPVAVCFILMGIVIFLSFVMPFVGITLAIVLTIPLLILGVYFSCRFAFSNLAYVDHKGGIVESVRYSWHITKGSRFWTVFLTVIVSFVLMMIGIVAFGIGVIITYPLVMLTLAQLYRALDQQSVHGTEQQHTIETESVPVLVE